MTQGTCKVAARMVMLAPRFEIGTRQFSWRENSDQITAADQITLGPNGTITGDELLCRHHRQAMARLGLSSSHLRFQVSVFLLAARPVQCQDRHCSRTEGFCARPRLLRSCPVALRRGGATDLGGDHACPDQHAAFLSDPPPSASSRNSDLIKPDI